MWHACCSFFLSTIPRQYHTMDVLVNNVSYASARCELILSACRFIESGGVFKLAFGPKAFIVVSDPVVVRHILKASL